MKGANQNTSTNPMPPNAELRTTICPRKSPSTPQPLQCSSVHLHPGMSLSIAFHIKSPRKKAALMAMKQNLASLVIGAIPLSSLMSTAKVRNHMHGSSSWRLPCCKLSACFVSRIGLTIESPGAHDKP